MLAAVVALCGAGPARAAALFDHPRTPQQLVDSVLAGVAGKMAATRVLTGRFVQHRQISGLPRPLVSSGDFQLATQLSGTLGGIGELARDAGSTWRTHKPFESELVLAPDGMTLRSGGTEQRLSSTEQPALQAALGLLFAMFAMDLDRLDAAFELFGQAQDGSWQLGLRPRAGGLAQVFTSAVITGSAQVDRIELSSDGGDSTVIEFSGVVAQLGR